MLRIWALIILVVGQLHLCHAEFVRPTGEDCGVCHAELLAFASGHREMAEGDSCRDCCEVKSCHEAPRQSAVPPSLSWSVAAVISPVAVSIEVPDRVVVPDRFWLIEASPPHAPPPLKSSRAPPALLN